MKSTIVKKPVSLKDLKVIKKANDPLCNIVLLTGVRIKELERVIKEWDGESSYVDILTKKSYGYENRIWLTEEARSEIKRAHLRGFKERSGKTYQRAFKTLSETLKIPFTAHNLRANFATQLLSQGIDLVTVSTFMNHSDISITARYIKVDESKLLNTLVAVQKNESIEGFSHREAIEEVHKLRRKLVEMEGRNNE